MPSIKFNSTIIAHRGASAKAPENTLAAFSKAQKLGVAWIEFDVMLTACGELIVFHDDTLERTTNGMGKISEKSYRYIKTLDAGSWFHPDFCDERVPTFKQVIEFIRLHPIAANIEIKVVPGQEKKVAEIVMQQIQQYWPQHLSFPLISSSSFLVLQSVRHSSSTALLAFILHEWHSGWEKECEQLQCIALVLNHELVNPQKLIELQLLNQFILCYTVNDKLRTEELFSWGVDGIFSDIVDADEFY